MEAGHISHLSHVYNSRSSVLCKNKLTQNEQLACKVNGIQRLSRSWSRSARLHDVPVVHIAGFAHTYPCMFAPRAQWCATHSPMASRSATQILCTRAAFCKPTLQGDVSQWHADSFRRLKHTNWVSCRLWHGGLSLLTRCDWCAPLLRNDRAGRGRGEDLIPRTICREGHRSGTDTADWLWDCSLSTKSSEDCRIYD